MVTFFFFFFFFFFVVFFFFFFFYKGLLSSNISQVKLAGPQFIGMNFIPNGACAHGANNENPHPDLRCSISQALTDDKRSM